MSAEPKILVTSSTLTLPTDLEAIKALVDWFEQFNRPPLTPRLWIEAKLALLEGFTNVVRHAHQPLSPETPVDIQVNLLPHLLEINLWDYGQPYDFAAALRRLDALTLDPNFNPLERQTQWGSIMLLNLQKTFGWTVQYRRGSDERNCLHIQKQL